MEGKGRRGHLEPVSGTGSTCHQRSRMLKAGQWLPGFEARRLPGHALDFWAGAPERIASRDLTSDSPALLAVVKRDCPTCLYALPFFERLYGLHGGLAPVILVAQENEVGAGRMVQDHRLKIPVLLDEEPHLIGEELEVSFVPGVFLVSPGGEIELSFESFERESLREIHQRLSRMSGRPETVFYQEDEVVDAFRPG